MRDYAQAVVSICFDFMKVVIAIGLFFIAGFLLSWWIVKDLSAPEMPLFTLFYAMVVFFIFVQIPFAVKETVREIQEKRLKDGNNPQPF